ncbi:MAG: Gfo/Idh/MocA family oxidoreductase [Candidatus Mariimomonas ferrooxydans]
MKNSKLLKIGVIGVGSIGNHHARIFSNLPGVDLIGVVDIDFSKAQKIASKYNCRAYKDYLKVMNLVDAVSIAVPTTMHYKIAMDFVKNDKDILIEKPITSTVEEAERIVSLGAKKGLIIQVGHLERFNSGLFLISSMIKNPRFIESMRLSPFLGRSTDVDVTLDLMIHDIDIILSLVKSEVSDLRATGSKVLTDNIDIAYAWLEFDNGCMAEVVASRIADEKVRQLKVFQQNAYLNLNYQTQEVSCYKKNNDIVETEVKKPEGKEPLKEQLVSFVECIKTRAQPTVSGDEGKKALQVALKISEIIDKGNTTKKRK